MSICGSVGINLAIVRILHNYCHVKTAQLPQLIGLVEKSPSPFSSLSVLFLFCLIALHIASDVYVLCSLTCQIL